MAQRDDDIGPDLLGRDQLDHMVGDCVERRIKLDKRFTPVPEPTPVVSVSRCAPGRRGTAASEKGTAPRPTTQGRLETFMIRRTSVAGWLGDKR
jgi:hypothetical protein